MDRARWRNAGRQILQRQARVPQNPGQQIVEIVRDAAGQNAQALQLLRLPHLLGLSLLFRDVARHVGDADDLAGLCSRMGEIVKRDIDRGPSFRTRTVSKWMTGLPPRSRSRMSDSSCRRSAGSRSPWGGRSPPQPHTIETFGAGVPGLNHSGRRLPDDRVVGRFDDRSQVCGILLRAAALRDIPKHQHHADRSPVLFDWARRYRQSGFPCRPAQSESYDSPARRCCPSRSTFVPGSPPCVRLNSLTIRNTSSIGLPAISGSGQRTQGLRDRIGEDNPSRRVGGDHRVADAGEGRLERDSARFGSPRRAIECAPASH